MSNPAFVSDADAADGHPTGNGKPKVNPFSLQEGEEFGAKTDRERIREGCSCLGLVPLPCFKCFLKAPWLLAFLCWASTIQVNEKKILKNLIKV